LPCYTCRLGDKCNMFLSAHTRSSQNDPVSSSDSSGCITSHIVITSIILMFNHLFKSAVFAFVYFYLASCQVFIRDSSIVHTTETPVTVFCHFYPTIGVFHRLRLCLAILFFLLVCRCAAFCHPKTSHLCNPCYQSSLNVVLHHPSIGMAVNSLCKFSSVRRSNALVWLKLLPSTSTLILL